jgi:hypothetical protein
MEHKKLRDITMGGLAAEHDASLEQYFFETDMFRGVALGHTKILIGNRGSGKSAIFKVLTKKEKGSGTLVEEITPSDYMYDFLKNSRQFDSNAEWARLGAYTASWKYVILVTAMRLLHARYKHQKVSTEHVNRIKVFLRDNAEEHLLSPVDLLVKFLKKFGSVSRLSLEGIQFDDKSNQLENLYKLDHIKHVIPSIAELTQHTRVLILFDELDQGWDASDDARQFIAGLFRAAIQINQQFPGIDILITIREEIYQNIPELYDDAQKIRDIIEHVRWTPEELKMMIAQRIRHALETLLDKRVKLSNADGLWEYIFEKDLEENGISTFKYIVDRTLYRPRELIFFVNECLKVHNKEEKIGQETIEKVERGYSKNRLDDIASEFKFQYGGLREVFETFRLAREKWERTELEDHWLEIVEGVKPCPEAMDWLNENTPPGKLIEILWNVGFLRAFMKIGQTPSEADAAYYVGYHQEPTLNIALIRYFDIHPMFRSHLGVGLNMTG